VAAELRQRSGDNNALMQKAAAAVTAAVEGVFFGASSCLLVTLQQKDTTVDRGGEEGGVVQMARRDSRRGQSRAHSNKAWRRAQWFFGPGVAVCQVGCGRSHSAHSELKRSSSAANPTEQPKFPRVCQNQSRFYRKSFTLFIYFYLSNTSCYLFSLIDYLCFSFHSNS